MAEPTRPLAAIELLESQVFRLGQTARLLLTEHAADGLTIYQSFAVGYDDEASATLHLRADSFEGASTVAAALVMELRREIHDGYHVRETVHGETVVDGITVELHASRALPDDEAAAWRAAQKAPAAEGGDA
jgi:hypothetical protein